MLSSVLETSQSIISLNICSLSFFTFRLLKLLLHLYWVILIYLCFYDSLISSYLCVFMFHFVLIPQHGLLSLLCPFGVNLDFFIYYFFLPKTNNFISKISKVFLFTYICFIFLLFQIYFLNWHFSLSCIF